MTFYQALNGYFYNSDSIILYDFAISCNIKKDVLEVGSGCGIIGLLCARDRKINLTQIEIQKDFSFLSSKNAEINSIESKVINDNFLNYTSNERYDYIISNPPFYRNDDVSSNNIKIAYCKMSKFLEISKFFKHVKYFLKPNAHFIFCYEASSIHLVLYELTKNHFSVEKMKFVHPKEDKASKVVLISARLNSKSSIKILPPLFIQKGDSFSTEMLDMYDKANTYSIKCELW